MSINQDIIRCFALGLGYGLGKRYARMGWCAWDAENEKLKWISTENGTHIPLKNGEPITKTGKKILGEGKEPQDGNKQKRPPPRPHRDLSGVTFKKSPKEYLDEANGDEKKAIKNCFRNELLGGYVKRKLELNGQEVEVEIGFTNRTLDEFQKYTNKNTLYALPKVTEIITTGDYAGRKPEPNHSPEVAFHTFMKQVKVDQNFKLVAVDVGESEDRRFYAYSTNQSGQPTFAKKLEHFEQRRNKRDSDVHDEQASTKRLEVVGIRFIDKKRFGLVNQQL